MGFVGINPLLLMAKVGMADGISVEWKLSKCDRAARANARLGSHNFLPKLL